MNGTMRNKFLINVKWEIISQITILRAKILQLGKPIEVHSFNNGFPNHQINHYMY